MPLLSSFLAISLSALRSSLGCSGFNPSLCNLDSLGAGPWLENLGEIQVVE